MQRLRPSITTKKLRGEEILGECFDLTFFAENAKIKKDQNEVRLLELLNIKHGKNQLGKHKFPLLTGKELFYEVYPEYDFTGYWLAITELVFTKKNFDDKLKQIIIDFHANNQP